MSQRYIGGLIYNPPGGFSGYFDGTGDYLTVASNAAFGYGTGNFTIEFWYLPLSFGVTNIIVDQRTSGATEIVPTIYTDSSSGTLYYYVNGANRITGGNLALNLWQHIAVSRSGTSTRLFVNGNQVGLTYSDSNNYANSLVSLGAYAVNGTLFANAYISNLRILKGTALYTAAFTPPNGPLQAITNTSLLTCAYPTFRDGSTNNFTITVNGNTAVSTQNPFPLTALPNPALGNAGNGVYTLTQYQSLRSQNLWPALDQYFDYVTLLLHGNGTNGAQNNTFLDSSTNNFTITRNGNTTQGTFSPYGDYWSNYFDGTGDFLDTPGNTAFAFGTGDFTVEAWVNTGGDMGRLVTNRQPSAALAGTWSFNVSNTVLAFTEVIAGEPGVTSNVAFNVANQWAHVAVARQGTTLRLFVNGLLVGSGTFTNNLSSTTQTLKIGGAFTGEGTRAAGYISNLRLIKGTALYTANFTPPTQPLTAITNTSLLTCQSNRFRDASANNFAITRNGDVSVQKFSPFNPTVPYAPAVVGASGYFDGAGDYLTAPNNTAFDLSTSDFTISYWIYPISTAAFSMIATYANGVATNSNYCFATSMNAGGAIRFDNFSGNNQLTVTGGVVVARTWNFITITRSGASATVYVNNSGTTGTVYATSNLPASSLMYVGSQPDASSPVNGYLADFRIVKGAATAPGANPTTPLTAITNTSLLLNFTNAGVIDNSALNNLETVGNAQISTAQSQFGGASLAFDGTGDYLLSPQSQNYVFGTGDFTVECWFYRIAATSGGAIVGAWSGTTATSAWIMTQGSTSSSNLRFGVSDGTNTAFFEPNVSVINSNTWVHLAVTRNSGTLYLFANGILLTSVSNTTNISVAAALGVGAVTNNTFASNGYIDDLRITKGIARYTTNFVPQRSQWQDQ